MLLTKYIKSNRLVSKMKFRIIRSRILKNIFSVVIASVLGMLLLLAVFCLPKDKMFRHVYQSLPILEKEFTDGIVLDGYPASLTGNFTDCLMLFFCIYDNQEHSTLEQVMHMYRGESSEGEGWMPGVSLRDYCNGIGNVKEVEYSRYWHGYLVILKPLLMLTNLNSIRMLMSVTQLLLIGLIIYYSTIRNEGKLALAFLISFPFFYFASMFMSLSLSICFYIMTIVVLIQLRFHEELDCKNWYMEFFLVTGMATAYFDFLTYPLVTLAFPLVVSLYLDKVSWKTKMQKLTGYSVQWGIGYAGLWVMKWVLSDLLTGSNVIDDAVSTLLSRTGTASNGNKFIGLFLVIDRNLEVYLNWSFYILGIFAIVWLVYYIAKNKQKYCDLMILKQRMVIISVAMYPIIWYFVTQNHSEEHYMFTCKNIAIIIFSVICGIIYETERYEGESDENLQTGSFRQSKGL